MALRTMRRQLLLTASIALVAAGCESVEITGSLGTGGLTRGQSASFLVGRWFRVESAAGFGGTVTQTSWEFRIDGTATRTVTVRAPEGEVLETTQSQLGWRAGRGVLTLAFDQPTLRTLSVPYAIEFGVQGTVLYLQGVPYLRVEP
jgi:hypothetical protein